MCGIAGFWSKKIEGDRGSTMQAMLARIKSRGPDGYGVWSEEEVTLGHNRLSILDLSEAGHQPMVSPSGRYVMTYNGEVYNHRELRQDLPADIPYKGHSDSETILCAIDYWGLEATIQKCVGMFALAVFDRTTKHLCLVRDPIGIKPLYYGWSNGTLMFASQLKAFLTFPGFSARINEKAMAMYFKYNYVPAPHAIYEGFFKQKPGTIISFENGHLVGENTYWSLENAYTQGQEKMLTEENALNAIESQLKQSIKRQLVADVPVGVFLSGGIDSSLIAALAIENKPDLQTFSIGFEEEKYNEAVHAKEIAKYLGTQHTEEYLSIHQARDMLENGLQLSDEPFGDSSQLPTYLLCQMTRKHVKVALSGDGGDELFVGYQRYADMNKLRRVKSFVPRSMRVMVSKMLESARFFTHDQNSFKMHMAAKAMRHNGIECQYDNLFQFWPHEKQQSLGPHKIGGMREIDYMSYHDMHLYLPGDILTKVDQCSMAVSLEARVPFLDQPFVEESFKVPSSLKMGARGLKTILKEMLDKRVPRNLTERPKQGFALPIDEWLRGPLKAWAMDTWAEILKDAPVDRRLLEKRMNEHQSGQCNWQYAIWNMLMWQQWKAK